MKAIRVNDFGPPEVLKLEEMADPSPAAGQLVVRIKAVGVNPVETYIRAGTYPYKPKPPYTPGTDAAGIVEAVGDGVTKFKPGDRVYTAGSISGTYAELALCDVVQVHALPDVTSFEQGAALHVPYATAYNALVIRAGARAGQSVLVHGATGGVGLAAVQFGVAMGVNVFATGGSEKGRQLVRDQGAHHVLDHKDPTYIDQIKAATGGRGVDVILEMVANVNLDKDLSMLAKRGCIAVIGTRGSVEIDPRKLLNAQGHIVGVQGVAVPEEVAQSHAAIGAGLRSGTLKPFIGKSFPLSDAPAAHHEIIEGDTLGKIVLKP